MRRSLTLLAIMIAGPAFADEPDQILPPVVVTATRIPTPVEDIPAGVSVVTRETIEVRDYNTLVEALSAIPGVRVSQSGGPGGNASVFVRGTNSNQVLVLRDGMPINDSGDASGAFNFGVDTLADIVRIEVVRGPMAALYGSGAIGGVINMISRKGTDEGNHVLGDFSAGYPAQGRGSVVASGIGDGLDYALTLEGQAQRGYDSTPQRASIYTGTHQPFRDGVVTLNTGYTVVPGTRLSVLLRARQSNFGFNELGDPAFDDDNATGDDVSLLGRVGISSALFGGSYQTGVFLGRLQDDRHYVEKLNLLDPNLASVDDRYHGYRTDLQWNNTIHLNDFFNTTVLSATDATFGFEYTGDAIKVRTNDNYAGFPYAQNANASMTDNALYAGVQSTIWRRLIITGQVRQDWVGAHTPTTWRLGTVLDAPRIDTHFHAAYGTAFRAPSLFDRYGVDSTGYVGNPNLRPESAQGWEAGFATTLPVAQQANFVTVDATYFNEQINNLIVAVFTPVDTATNIGSAHIQGVESELTLNPAPWLSVQATGTYSYAENADTGSRLLRRPQFTGSLDATIKPIPNLTIAPELVFTGAFQDYLVNDAGFSTSNIGSSPQGLIANLTITYDLTQRFQFYANGTNIFNSRWEPVNGYQTPGATFVAGVRIRL